MASVAYRNLGASLILAACTFTLAPTSLAGTAAAATKAALPTRIRATSLTDPTGPAYPTRLAFGTSARWSRDELVAGPVWSGNTGWAVVWDGPAGNLEQYPLHTGNHGRTWTIAGPWLAITGAAGANVNSLTVFSKKVVVAYAKGMNVLDVTWDAGRLWYSAWMPGNIVDVTPPKAPPPRAGFPVAMQATVRSLGHPVATLRYFSASSGREWRLSRSP